MLIPYSICTEVQAKRNIWAVEKRHWFDRHANLKYKYGSRNFWCRGYYVDTAGRNKKVIAEYIRNQLEEDYTLEQMSIKEYTDPFTGSKNSKA